MRHRSLLDSEQADAKSRQQPGHSKTALELVKLLEQCNKNFLGTAHFASKTGEKSLTKAGDSIPDFRPT